MAKSLLKVKTKKVTKVTRSEQYLVNVKYLGEEPAFKGELSLSEYARALHWYNSMCTVAEAREYIVTYLTNTGRDKDLNTFLKLPDIRVATTVAWIARMISRGLVISDESKQFFTSRMKEMLSSYVSPAKEVSRVSIHQRTKDKSEDIIAEIESTIDTNPKFSLYEWLKGKSIPALYGKEIASYYAPWLDELLEASTSEDPQLKEAYSYMNKKQLKERILFMNKLIEDAEKYSDTTKLVRKVSTRKPQPVSIEKIFKSFRYQKEDNKFKIASIDPQKILGAKELWTFSTKYKTITVYRANDDKDDKGLAVSGMSITNFNVETSKCKVVTKIALDMIERVLKTPKNSLKIILTDVGIDKQISPRINEFTVLLRVVQ